MERITITTTDLAELVAAIGGCERTVEENGWQPETLVMVAGVEWGVASDTAWHMLGDEDDRMVQVFADGTTDGVEVTSTDKARALDRAEWAHNRWEELHEQAEAARATRRGTVMLAHEAGATQREIAERLGISQPAVAALLKREGGSTS